MGTSTTKHEVALSQAAYAYDAYMGYPTSLVSAECSIWNLCQIAHVPPFGNIAWTTKHTTPLYATFYLSMQEELSVTHTFNVAGHNHRY